MEQRVAPKKTSRTWLLILIVILVILSVGMLLGFVLGFMSSILATPGDYGKATQVGFKAGLMMTSAVFTIGIVGLTLKRFRVPPQIESALSFGAGFAVMNGLKAWLENNTARLWPEVGTGFFLGVIIGSVMFIFRRRGLVPTATERKK